MTSHNLDTKLTYLPHYVTKSHTPSLTSIRMDNTIFHRKNDLHYWNSIGYSTIVNFLSKWSLNCFDISHYYPKYVSNSQISSLYDVIYEFSLITK